MSSHGFGFGGTPADLLGLRRVGTRSCLDWDMEALELVQIIPWCAHLNDERMMKLTPPGKHKKNSGRRGTSRVESRDGVWHYFVALAKKKRKCVPSEYCTF